MTLSIWRYSHLTLAISSFLFIIIAAITGIILAFEPVSNQLETYSIPHLSEVSVAEMITVLQEEYEEVISVEIDNNSFVVADIITKEGESQTCYIDPKTGKKLGDLKPKASIYKFATTLHRSLFLKSVGRFFVGLVSFLLFLITVSGLVLILKRQGSLKKFFNKVTWENFYQYFHVVLGRLSIIPLIIITISGVYLSLEKFNLLPKEKISHVIDFDHLKAEPQQKISNFKIFQQTKLSELSKIDFPFSPDVEDYFLVQVTDKEFTVNQITGEVLSEANYPFTKVVAYYSLLLHTGQGSIIWAIILALSSIATLFFIYSGFAMTFQRIKGKTRNKFKKEVCEYVILVGTENGSTQTFAKMLYKAMINAGKKVFITDLNKYTTFENMEHLVVLTATYGEGEAPSNASKFLKLLQDKTINNHPFSFSVVAFGSLAYPKFCQFGYDVDAALTTNKNATMLLPIYTINNKSFEAFLQWKQEFSSIIQTELKLDKTILTKREKTVSLPLVKKVTNDLAKDTFLLEFDCNKKFTSGDLLGIYPNDQEHERLYSIAKINDKLLLSVKRHELGICSNYLHNLVVGNSINAYVKKNPTFHFPKKAPKVIMIATGTGIAPFLGMINESKSTTIDLYFGLPNKASLQIYESVLNEEKLSKINYVFSREGDKKVYVQDVIGEQIGQIISDLHNGTVIMICGAIAMQNAIFLVLETALEKNGKTLSYYKKRNQILVDCY